MTEKRLIGIDTNVLVHMVDSADDRKHSAALEILKDIHRDPSSYVVSIQVLGELSNVVNSKYPSVIPHKNALLKYLSQSVPIVHYTVQEILSAGDSRNFWDAVLALTYIRAGATVLLTENTADFSRFSNRIQIVNPFE